MKIILLKDIPKLGHRYEVRDVSDGHAINLLIPQGSAVTATASALKKYEILRKAAETERKIHEDLLVKNLVDLDGKTITIKGKTNEQGHLFAGLHKAEIAAEIKKQTELDIDPTFIQLENPLKQVGEYTIEVTGHRSTQKTGKTVKLKVIVEKVTA